MEKKKNGCLIAALCVVVFGTVSCGTMALLGSIVSRDDNQQAVTEPIRMQTESLATETEILQTQSETLQTQTETPTTEENTEEQESATVQSSDVALSSDAICLILKAGLSQSFGDDAIVEYSEEAKNYKISIWKDGIAVSFATIPTNPKAKDAWETMKNSIKNMSSELQNTVQNYQPDAHVTVMVLNDLDHSKVLMTVLDGVLIYDAAGELTQ